MQALTLYFQVHHQDKRVQNSKGRDIVMPTAQPFIAKQALGKDSILFSGDEVRSSRTGSSRGGNSRFAIIARAGQSLLFTAANDGHENVFLEELNKIVDNPNEYIKGDASTLHVLIRNHHYYKLTNRESVESSRKMLEAFLAHGKLELLNHDNEHLSELFALVSTINDPALLKALKGLKSFDPNKIDMNTAIIQIIQSAIEFNNPGILETVNKLEGYDVTKINKKELAKITLNAVKRGNPTLIESLGTLKGFDTTQIDGKDLAKITLNAVEHGNTTLIEALGKLKGFDAAKISKKDLIKITRCALKFKESKPLLEALTHLAGYDLKKLDEDLQNKIWVALGYGESKSLSPTC